MIGPLRTTYDRNSAFMRVLMYDTAQASKVDAARIKGKVLADLLNTVTEWPYQPVPKV